MGLEAPSHWIIIAVIVIALFGYKKLPDAARSLGKSMRVFKSEIKEMTGNDSADEVAEPPAVMSPAVMSPAVSPVAEPAPRNVGVPDGADSK